MRSIVVTVRQVSKAPQTWDWVIDWHDEQRNLPQRNSGTATSFDVAMDRARDELIELQRVRV